METTSGYDRTRDSSMQMDDAPAIIAAVFPDRDSAHAAAHQLHDEGFRDTWIGLTRSDDVAGYSEGVNGGQRDPATAIAAGETRIESDNWFTRFFGEGDETLSDALERHGVPAADARAAGNLPAHSAILTIDGSNHPELAVQIIRQSGGRIITRGFGATGYGTSGAFNDYAGYGDEAPESRTTSLYDDGLRGDPGARTGAFATGTTSTQSSIRDTTMPAAVGQRPLETEDGAAMSTSANGFNETYGNDETTRGDATAFDDYGRYRAGTPVDEATRLQLREERLRIDKSRVSRGEATVGTEVVTETQTLDVPIIREELFVQRRAVTDASQANGGPAIGEENVIRVPLTQERVVVTKEPVVTEEVLVGKREVQDTQHISETTRKEQLKVDDASTAMNAGGARGIDR